MTIQEVSTLVQALTGLIMALNALVVILIHRKLDALPTKEDTARVADALKQDTSKIAEALTKRNGDS
jgi:hypothetical protein